MLIKYASSFENGLRWVVKMENILILNYTIYFLFRWAYRDVFTFKKRNIHILFAPIRFYVIFSIFCKKKTHKKKLNQYELRKWNIFYLYKNEKLFQSGDKIECLKWKHVTKMAFKSILRISYHVCRWLVWIFIFFEIFYFEFLTPRTHIMSEPHFISWEMI